MNMGVTVKFVLEMEEGQELNQNTSLDFMTLGGIGGVSGEPENSV